ncbi:multiple epidermal growth factor-like domains protein 10 isoform X1 [Dinothrombium tinctorium]|uniref:Multiple epidermal growth factor-like domains protein 10 isoform X1 n=1 Tax=Dinothrombium tinctorium TaxID=1965070 RepID=A0A443QS58_9ACAR|nr:multiple epidermal growth factor-like domains protein 10 isoform X1 [Dinothrombium tinctorium]
MNCKLEIILTSLLFISIHECLIVRQPQALNDQCNNTEECKKFSVNTTCSLSKRCVCIIDHVNVRGRCYKPIDLLRKCSINDECEAYDKNAICSSTKRICECKSGFAIINDRCIQIRFNPTLFCSHNDSCRKKYSNSVCKSGKCACIDGLEMVGGKCMSPPKIPLGSECTSNQQCEQFDSNSECNQTTKGVNICKCRSGFSLFQRAGFSFCSLSMKKLGDRCDNDGDCMNYDRYSRCRRKDATYRCLCPSGRIKKLFKRQVCKYYNRSAKLQFHYSILILTMLALSHYFTQFSK